MLSKLWNRAGLGVTVITTKYSQLFRAVWEMQFYSLSPTLSEPPQPGQVLSGG